MKQFPSNHLALDQALANSGVAFYDPINNGEKIFVDCIKTNSKATVGDRLLTIETHLRNLLAKLGYPKVYYEYVYSGKFTPYESIKVLGLLEKIIADNQLESDCYRSSAKEKKSWRALLGVSNRKKDLQEKLGLINKVNHNISDAIGILGAGLITDGIISLDDFYKLEIVNANRRNFLQCSNDVREVS